MKQPPSSAIKQYADLLCIVCSIVIVMHQELISESLSFLICFGSMSLTEAVMTRYCPFEFKYSIIRQEHGELLPWLCNLFF